MRILFVDDERSLRLLVSRMLQDAYEVTTAASGWEALRLIGTHPYDLLITDCEMPGLGGLDLITMVRRQDPAARCLVASGNLDEARVAWLHRHHVPFISKPWRMRDFLDLVASTLST